MKKLTILGSTGSIGTQTLAVIEKMPDKFQIINLTAHRNIKLLSQQAIKFKAEAVCISDCSLKDDLSSLLVGNQIEILSGKKGLLELAARDNVDLMVNGLVGSAGMSPTIGALSAGLDVALSNKESLVMAGGIINNLLRKHNSQLYPIDSEHSAIWQCLRGEKSDQVKRLILTGSGGPFRTRPLEAFAQITTTEALRHPNWEMGAKITIDSATMMNKGLEVIEAHWLFNISPDQIDILIHPQSIIHSLVEFIDGSVKAQLGVPDMKIPIQYALSYPDHVAVSWAELDLTQVGALTFEKPNLQKFRCIQLAYDALRQGGSYPVVLNVANDQVVFAFLENKIRFTDIPELIEDALEKHDIMEHPNLNDIGWLSNWTKKFIETKVKERIVN